MTYGKSSDLREYSSQNPKNTRNPFLASKHPFSNSNPGTGRHMIAVTKKSVKKLLKMLIEDYQNFCLGVDLFKKIKLGLIDIWNEIYVSRAFK